MSEKKQIEFDLEYLQQALGQVTINQNNILYLKMQMEFCLAEQVRLKEMQAFLRSTMTPKQIGQWLTLQHPDKPLPVAGAGKTAVAIAVMEKNKK